MAGLNRWLVHCNLISTTLVDGWFTLNLISITLVMAGSLKFDLDCLSRCLAHWNLISTLVDDWFTEIWSALVDGCFTEIWSRPSCSMAGSHLTWSQPPWLMAGSLKFDLDRLGRWVVHLNLISTVSVDGYITLNLISTALVDGWLTEIWSRWS